MFRRISYTIALQFTAFVFILFLINGAVFLFADLDNAKRQAEFRLDRTARQVMNQLSDADGIDTSLLPPPVRDRVRVIGKNNTPVYSGTFFRDIPFAPGAQMTNIEIQGEQYNVFTLPIRRNNRQGGYIQVAEIERLPIGDLPFRAALYLLVSALVSALTFAVGLFFARRNLRPAAETMERLSQFTQDASHELRTPLAVLNSSLDLSLKTKKYKEGILSAKEDVKEISVLVERLLELARLDKVTLNRTPVDFSALVQETMEKYEGLATEKGITLTSAIAPNMAVTGDPSLLRQVIGNLLSNAIKFNAEHGAITVTLTKETLTIADTGIGIAQKEQAHIFDRFYQADTSRANDGFGLGLALVKRIVDLHRWAISVKSKEGKGAMFVIQFTA